MGRGVLALLWQLSSVQCRHLYSSVPTATIDANFYENYAPFRPKTCYEPDHFVRTYLRFARPERLTVQLIKRPVEGEILTRSWKRYLKMDQSETDFFLLDSPD